MSYSANRFARPVSSVEARGALMLHLFLSGYADPTPEVVAAPSPAPAPRLPSYGHHVLARTAEGRLAFEPSYVATSFIRRDGGRLCRVVTLG